jgi:hypothetical protein
MRAMRPLFLLLVAALLMPARAEDAKPADKKSEPRVILVSAPGLVRGRTNKLVLRGFNLGETTVAWIDGFPRPATQPAATQATSQSASSQPATTQATSKPAPELVMAVRMTAHAKSEVGKPFEPVKAGDSQVDLEVDLPPTGGAAEVTLVLATKEGEAKSPALHVLDASNVIDEQEPNDGFRQAQAIEFGKVVRGVIQVPSDVDVFQFRGRVGQKVRIEVLAARAGSLLDSTITLYDSRGHVLFSNDDSELGSDSLLVETLPSDGTYYLSLTDANESGSVVHGYELTVKAE